MSYQALLFCPEEKTAGVVTHVLSSLEFAVELCNEPFAAVKKLTTQHYDAVVVDCENEQNAGLLFKSARNSESNHSSLAVAVVEGQAGVAKAFRIGANLVLTKPINVDQAKGTLRVARGLLRKSEGGKPAAPPMKPAAAPVTPVSAATAPARLPERSVAAAPKPSFQPLTPKFTPPVPSVPAAAAASAFSAPVIEDEPVSEASIDEDMSVAPAPEAAPEIASSATVRPAAKEYPWQPVSKSSAGPMANSLKRAAEAASTSDEPLQLDDAPEPGISAPAVSQSRPAMSFSAAASAPARAKQPAQSTKVFEPKKLPQSQPEDKPKAAPAPTKLSITDPLAEERVPISEPSVPLEAPKFESGESKSGSKTGIIAVAAIAVLAAAGYFGWTKYHTQVSHLAAPSVGSSAATPPASAATAPATTISSEAVSAPEETASVPQQIPEAVTPKASAQKPQPEKVSAAKSKPAQDNTDDQEAPEEQQSAPAAIIVKNGTGPSAKPAAQPQVQAPDAVMASSGGEKALSGIVGSVSTRVPKESLQELRVSQGVMQTMIVKKVSPRYPIQAERMRVQGAVQLAVTIGKDGHVLDVSQVGGDKLLGKAAMDAVAKWEYKPYTVSGQPIRVKTQVTIDFKLP